MKRKSGRVNWMGLQSDFCSLLFTSPVLTILVFESLATNTEYVRTRLAEYANDLISLGVDGLRLDAAKSK